MIALDSTVFIQIASFLVLWFLLNKILFKPFLGLLEERERKTEGVKAESASLTEEGERLRAEYEGKISHANDEGRAVKESILQEARQQRERLLGQAREEAAGLLERVRQEVQTELRKERELAGREAEAVAQEMASKILGRRVG
jgi:F-type H+-transporting ATPase subunit b